MVFSIPKRGAWSWWSLTGFSSWKFNDSITLNCSQLFLTKKWLCALTMLFSLMAKLRSRHSASLTLVSEHLHVWLCCPQLFLSHGSEVLCNNSEFDDILLCFLFLPIDYWIKFRLLNLIYKPLSWLQHTVQNRIGPLLLKSLLKNNFPLIPSNPCPLKFSFSLSSPFWLTPSGLSKGRWSIMCFCIVFPDSPRES